MSSSSKATHLAQFLTPGIEPATLKRSEAKEMDRKCKEALERRGVSTQGWKTAHKKQIEKKQQRDQRDGVTHANTLAK